MTTVYASNMLVDTVNQGIGRHSGDPALGKSVLDFIKKVSGQIGFPEAKDLNKVSAQELGAASMALTDMAASGKMTPQQKTIMHAIDGHGTTKGLADAAFESAVTQKAFDNGGAKARGKFKGGLALGLMVGGVMAANVLLNGGTSAQAAAAMHDAANPLAQTTHNLANGNLGAAARSGVIEGGGGLGGAAIGVAMGGALGLPGAFVGGVVGSVVGEAGMKHLLSQLDQAGVAQALRAEAQNKLVAAIPSDPAAIAKIKDPATRQVALAAHASLRAKAAHEKNPTDARLISESSRTDRLFHASVQNYFSQGENVRLPPVVAAEKGVDTFRGATNEVSSENTRPSIMIITRPAAEASGAPKTPVASNKPPQTQNPKL